jgi:hypothetical protein
MDAEAARRGTIGSILLFVIALLIGAALAEGAAQFYAHKIAKRGKLFQPDHELGWSLLPNNQLTRNNHDGEPWYIETDGEGVRGPSSWPADASRRMLVLGDSFAFGEGVDLEERFDSLIQEEIPDLAIVNLGVMGYGTDQQLIRAQGWIDQLREDDILLILTYSNDFFDVVSTHHSGRSKPWFESADGELVAHWPEIGLLEIARDRSYLMSLVASRLNVHSEDAFERRLKHAGDLYQQILADKLPEIAGGGIDVILVHHGDDVFDLPFDVDQVFAASCALVTSCLSLDRATSQYEKADIFLSDGHWNEGGHRVAAEQIAKHLREHYAAADRLR